MPRAIDPIPPRQVGVRAFSPASRDDVLARIEAKVDAIMELLTAAMQDDQDDHDDDNALYGERDQSQPL